MEHKRLAQTVIVVALSLDLTAALLFSCLEHYSILNGIYWASATATTVGYGDIIPKDTVGKILAIMVMWTVIPLISAIFSLITSGLTTHHVKKHVSESEERIKAHVSDLNTSE